MVMKQVMLLLWKSVDTIVAKMSYEQINYSMLATRSSGEPAFVLSKHYRLPKWVPQSK
jgi:hypothetical protein